MLWLNSTELTIDKASFTVGGAEVPARVVPGNDDFVGFAVDKPLQPGAAKLHVEWKGPVSRKDDRGLFAQKEGDRWYAITQFEAIFARRVFPCFDEPNIKVPWQLTLEVPKRARRAVEHATSSRRRRSIRGMKTRGVRADAAPADVPGGVRRRAVSSSSTPAPPGTKKTALRIAAPFGRGKDASYAAKNAGEFVDLLEKYFGIPFPYDKLDSVAIPITSTFGAMENAGHGHVRAGLLVAKPDGAVDPFRARLSRDGGARDRAPVVRRSGDDGVVGRHLAQRVVRDVDGSQDHRRVEAGVDASTPASSTRAHARWASTALIDARAGSGSRS